jgi:hypothetical protein
MKLIFFFTFIFNLILFSCSTEPEYMSQGIITGGDSQMCICCGGWFIEIADNVYRFYNLPDKNDINLNEETFPIKVRLSWKKDPNDCLGDEIIILQIEKN